MKRVDLVVAAATVLLATGFVLCAVMAVWRSANRFKCQLNLYHTGVLIPNYPEISGQGRCLPGTIPHATLPPEKRLSWIAEFKRHVGVDPSDLVRPDLTAAWDAASNAAMAGRPLTRFVCPSSGHGIVDGYAPTSYIGVAGFGRDAATLPLSSPRAGYFGYDRAMTHKHLKRGTSNVLMVLETTTSGPWAAGGPDTVRGIVPDEPFLAPGTSFGSHHRRGLACGLMADGSGRVLTADIAAAILAAMATLGGEGEGGGD